MLNKRNFCCYNGTQFLHYSLHAWSSLFIFIEIAAPPSSSEGITVIKLPNGDAQVTCTNPGTSCLVMFWSTIDLDSALVGFIQSFASSTVFSLTDSFSDGYVVVYSWNSGESVFSGRVSLVTQLDPPTSECMCMILIIHAWTVMSLAKCYIFFL